MKKVITAVIFLLSITGFARNGVWEIVSEISNPKVQVIFSGDNEKLSKSGDSESPSGIFMDYLDSSVTQGDGSDLSIVELKYNISDLKPGKAKVSSLKADLKSAQLVAAVSKKNDDTLMVLFNSDAYKDIKVYDKGNKTIINYNDLYIVFDKGDAELTNASAWN